MILEGNIPEESFKDVCRKLKMCDPEHFDRMLLRISRNLKAILFRDE